MNLDEDPSHAEHVKVLDALSSNLKSEVSRGLKLLDSCVTQIAQAKWILTNVDDSLSGFSKGCPVCGIRGDIKISSPVRREKVLPTITFSPRRSAEIVERVKEKPTAVKSPVSLIHQRKLSLSPVRAPAPTIQPVVHRVGPRSKTKPNEPIAVSAVVPTIPSPPKETSLSSRPRLPKKLNIVISQTNVQIPLTDVKPYLYGRSVKVDFNTLKDFESPKTKIPLDLQFKPKITFIKTPKVKPAGAASRKFLESLHKPGHDKSKIKTSSSSKVVSSANFIASSDSELENKKKAEKPKVPVIQKKPPEPPKKKSSDSGSDYDFNFAKSAQSNSTKKKSMIGSLSHLNNHKKRPRHNSSSDSDEEYRVKKKKSSKSIFKKKVSSSSESESDSDEYERRRKKKVKRKDSTDKEKDRKGSISTSKTHGSKSSSILSALRITFPVEGGKSNDKKLNSTTKCDRRESSASRGGGGSTTGSLVRSDSGREAVPKSLTKPPDTTSPVVKYKPGPASRKKALLEAPVTSTSSGVTEARPLNSLTKDGENKTDKPAVEETILKGVTQPTAKGKQIESNGVKSSGPAVKAVGTDPFALLKRKLSEESAAVDDATENKKKGVSSIMSMLNDPKAKAALIAKLSLMSSQKNKPPITKSLQPVLEPEETKSKLPEKSRTDSTESQENTQQVSLEDNSEKELLVTTTIPISEGTETEKEIELSDDVIDKCIGDLGGEDEDDEKGDTDPLPDTDNIIGFTISTMPPPTLQDCVSPTAMDKFFKAPLPDSSISIVIEKIQRLLLKLANEDIDDAALLHSQDKIKELFEFGVTDTSGEVETRRGDLQEGQWYLVMGKTIGRAVCSDTVSVFEWDQVSYIKLERILNELELYTASCIN